MSYSIEREPLYKNWWVVWEQHRNLKVEIHKARLKRECKEWCKKHKINV